MNFIVLILLFLRPSTPESIQGIWLSSDQEVKIRIYQKTDKKFYGQIIWFKESPDNGKFPNDIKNPDPALRQRKIIGLEILKDFYYDAPSQKWKNGTIYHPQHGKTFRGLMWLQGQELQIRGYWGLLYRTNSWTKVVE